MSFFRIANTPIAPRALAAELADPACGGYVSFEGWVRNHQDGRGVVSLEYEVYHPLALTEARQIMSEARNRFGVANVAAVHAEGPLPVGGLAVWVGAVAPHREEAFAGCRYVVDQIKVRLPIWKKEFYQDGDSGWVNCERCSRHAHEHVHAHVHAHVPEDAAMDTPSD